MNKTITLNQTEYDSFFIGAWIKYIRTRKNYTQEYVSHGVCSVSHLSYFENGVKPLHSDQIETILSRMDTCIANIPSEIDSVHSIIQNMLGDIELYDYVAAKDEYDKLLNYEEILRMSPYYLEYQICCITYRYFVLEMKLSSQRLEIEMLDKVYKSFPDDLRFRYLFISGILYFYDNQFDEGMGRLYDAEKIRRTTWLNYIIGMLLSKHSEQGRGIIYLERALDNYEMGGRYQNAIWCHSYLGCCFTELGMYSQAMEHFKAGLQSLQLISTDRLCRTIYNNFANMYQHLKDYNNCKIWSKKAMTYGTAKIIPTYNYIYACHMLGENDECRQVLSEMETPEYQENEYYPALEFMNLWINHFDDKTFYDRTKKEIIPYFEEVHKSDILNDIYNVMIEYLESRRKYKEATVYYRKLLGVTK